MAFVPFYLIAGGAGSADINAGSTIGAAVGGPTTGGSWVNATNTFVATGGTPFSAASVGDYVSIYADGATVTTYVAQITTKVSNVSVILSSTIKYGTAPTDGASNRSAVLGGSWNTEQVLAAGGLGTFTVPQSTKINITGNLTVTASRTISMAGAATAPLWFSAYSIGGSPGDLDNDTTNALTKPLWTVNSTFAVTSSGANTTWSSLSVVGSRSGTIWTQSASPARVMRMRAENTSSNAAAVAMTCNGAAAKYSYCWFKCPTTATSVTTQGNGGVVLIGCTAVGGVNGFNPGGTTATFIDCISLNSAGTGFLATNASLQIIRPTVYGAATDGVKWSGGPGAGSCVVGGLFSGLNGSTATTNGINNALGTNTDNVFRACNDYYNVTNPEVGFGDSPAFFGQTDSSSVVTSATDMTPVAGSNALAHGFPGIFENETFSSYVNIGAVMQIAASGFSGGIFGG